MNKDFKLCVMGENGTGKSALIFQFVENIFVPDIESTVEDNYLKQITLDGETCYLDILDTAPAEEYKAMRDQYIRTSNGFICAYSITSLSSFKEISILIEIIIRVKRENNEEKVAIVLVGTKSDLNNDRKISFQDARNLANKFGFPFFECSAKERINFNEPFYQLVREINRKKILENILYSQFWGVGFL